jgi:hypothetical protein
MNPLVVFGLILICSAAVYALVGRYVKPAKPANPAKPTVSITFTEDCFTHLREGKPDIIDLPQVTLRVFYRKDITSGYLYSVQGDGPYLGDLR